MATRQDIVTQHTKRPTEGPEAFGDPSFPTTFADEANFARLPLFPVAWSGLKKKTHTEFEFHTTLNDGTRQRHYWLVSADAKRGHVTPFDAKVFHAFEAHFTEILQRDGQLPRIVPFTVYRIGQLLGYTKLRGYERSPGSVYGKIKESMRRIRATSLTSERGFWSSDTEDWIELDFNLYTTLVFRGRRSQRSDGDEKCWIELHPIYHHNLTSRHVKYFDYAYLLSLPPLAARLYKLLSLKFYAIRNNPTSQRFYQTDYVNWCQAIPLTQQSRLGRATQILDPAHAVLRETGFLSDVRYRRSRKAKSFTIRYYMGERALDEMKGRFGAPGATELALPAPQPAIEDETPALQQGAQQSIQFVFARAKSARADEEVKLSPLAGELQSRGVKPASVATNLVEQHPAERIREKLDVLEHMQQCDACFAPENPAGWLRKAIQDDYDPPEHFAKAQESRAREQAEADRSKRWSDERKRRIEADLRDWDAVPPEERIAGFLAFRTMPMSQTFRKLVREHGEERARELIRQELLDELPKTEQERRAYLEREHDDQPPSDFK